MVNSRCDLEIVINLEEVVDFVVLLKESCALHGSLLLSVLRRFIDSPCVLCLVFFVISR